uniref:Formin binding protein 1 n=1 Tax=Paramormyrops kingsleyae TaxID=1676925 RepID=A0A3B3QV52_9TELE
MFACTSVCVFMCACLPGHTVSLYVCVCVSISVCGYAHTHRVTAVCCSPSVCHFRNRPLMKLCSLPSPSLQQAGCSCSYQIELMKRTLGKPTYAFEARQYVLSLKLITLNAQVRSLIEGAGSEDFSHLPPEQRRKKLQAKVDDINKDIEKEMDKKDALIKMKDVYVKNPHMGDPSSVDPRLAETGQNIEKLQLEAQKFEGWLAEVEGRMPVKSEPPQRQSVLYETQNSVPSNDNCAQDRESPDGSYTEEQSSEAQIKVPNVEFDDEFDDEETLPTIGTCKALYCFEGNNEGTISVMEGELLYVIEEDKGDGWTRVRRNEEEEGYVPTSYVEVFLDTNGKDA